MFNDLPLLLLHGALGSKEQFVPLQDLLGKKNIYSLDFSGHGENSALKNVFTLNLFAQDVIRFMQNNSMSRVNIFGHSMGGYIGLYMAMHYPEHIQKICTFGTKIIWSEESAWRETRLLDADKLQTKIPAFVEGLKKKHPSADWRELLERTKAMMLDLGKTNLLNFKALSTIKNPVRIIVGDRDTTAGLGDSVAAYADMPNAELEVFPCTPHPFEKAPLNRLARSIGDFFKL